MKGPLLPYLFVFLLGAAVGAATLTFVGSPTESELEFRSTGASSAPEAAEFRKETLPTLEARRQPIEEPEALPVGWSAAFASIPPAPQLKGDGTITGRVWKQQGGPFADLEVSLHQYTDRRSGSASTDEQDIESRVLDFARTERWREAQRRRTRTDAEGFFRFDGLPDGRFFVSAKLEGWTFVTSGGNRIGEVRPGAELVITAHLQASCKAEVIGIDGRLVDEATISVIGAGGDSRTNWTWRPDTAPFRAKPDLYKLQASSGDFGEYQSDEVAVNLVANAENETVRLQLKSREVLCGRILFETVDRSSFFEVRAAPAPDGVVPAERAFTRSNRDDMGPRETYAIFDLLPGRYAVALFDQGAMVSAVDFVDVQAGVNRHDIRFAGPPREKCLLVRVSGPDGSPVEVRDFGLEITGPQGSSSRGVVGMRQPDGSYLLPLGPSLEAGASATHRVTVSCRFGRCTETFQWTAQPEVDIHFEEPGRLEVTVAGFAGHPLRAELSVTAAMTAEGVRMRMSQVMGKRRAGDGRWEFEVLAPGDYVVSVVRGSRESSMILVRERIHVKSGPNELALALPSLQDLRVRASASGAGRVFRITGDESGFFASATTDEQGVALFKDLPPGTYQVRSQVGRPVQTVQIPGPAEIVFDEREANALQVRMTSDDSTFFRLGLKDGDQIVGMNGEGFTGETQMQRAFLSGLQSGKLKLAVVRGRERFELEIEITAEEAQKDLRSVRFDAVTR